MITLESYARHLHAFARAATVEHLRQTVFQPLGLDPTTITQHDGNSAMLESDDLLLPYESIYAIPPGTTNARFCGSGITDRAKRTLKAAAVKQQAEQLGGDVGDSLYEAPTSLESLGLPFCVCIRPKEACSASAAGLPPSLADKPELQDKTKSVKSSVPTVVVDIGCAEAVLRGSDVYVPGVTTAEEWFEAGATVRIGVFVERIPCARAAISEEAHLFKSAMATAATLPQELYTVLDDGEMKNLVRSRDASEDPISVVVCIGEGTAVLDSRTIITRAVRGVAIKTTWTPLEQPSRSAIESLLGIENTSRAVRDELFLQNYSSMVPVVLLVERLSRDCFSAASAQQRGPVVLDACAAPGGKTSLLISLLSERCMRETGERDSFSVVYCERSRSRFNSMNKLLEQHFGEEACSTSNGLLCSVLHGYCTDVNKLHTAMDKGVAMSEDGKNEPSSAPPALVNKRFDAVLLDPPCTGMGLRPKLLPHTHSVALVKESADYQRKLFDTCVKHLQATQLQQSNSSNPGTSLAPRVIVYSTCTITLEENEGNVLQILRTYPTLRLARTTTEQERRLCLSPITNYPVATATGESKEVRRFLLQDDILAVQREREEAATGTALDDMESPVLMLRFMPRASLAHSDQDGVGFFTAVFELHE